MKPHWPTIGSKKLVLLFAIVAATPMPAQVVRIPGGLNPGDEYRLTFLTSAMRDATSSNIEDYNEFVQKVADAASEVGSWGIEWKAAASTAEVDARDNTKSNPETMGPGVPIYLINGELMAADYNLFWNRDDNPLDVYYNVTELGARISPPNDFENVLAWAGSEPGGAGASSPRPRTLGSDTVLAGWAADDSQFVWGTQARPSQNLYHLYALSEVLTVPESSARWLYVAAPLLAVMIDRTVRLPHIRRRPPSLHRVEQNGSSLTVRDGSQNSGH